MMDVGRRMAWRQFRRETAEAVAILPLAQGRKDALLTVIGRHLACSRSEHVRRAEALVKWACREEEPACRE